MIAFIKYKQARKLLFISLECFFRFTPHRSHYWCLPSTPHVRSINTLTNIVYLLENWTYWSSYWLFEAK